MLKTIRNWYSGEVKVHKNVVGIYTKRHWTAKVARSIVTFYLKNWQWVLSTVLIIFGLYMKFVG